MALIGFNPGRVEVSVASSAKVTQQPRQITEAPGGLWPLQTKAFEMDDYRMMQGWPVPIPDYDIHCHSLVTARGEVFGVRDDNLSIKTGALMRWVADPNYYDPVALRWEPLVDDTGGQSVWETSVDYAPVLIDDYTYRVNNERFVEYALNFDSDTRNHMWADFGTSIGGSTGYTVIMVVSPNSVYGNDDDVVYNGLWCPGGPTPVGDTFEEPIPSIGWTALTFQGGWLYFQNHGKPRARAVPIQQEINSSAPMYLACCISPIESTFYVGFGPGRIRSASLPSGQNQDPLNDGIVLGRTNGDVLHTADMALFDLGIYGERLTPGRVREEFAILSRSYGGAD
jgi:hypothetical protein